MGRLSRDFAVTRVTVDDDRDAPCVGPLILPEFLEVESTV